MHIAKEIKAIESLLADRHESVISFCRRAGIAVSTWNRWRSNSHAPNLTTWMRVKAAAYGEDAA